MSSQKATSAQNQTLTAFRRDLQSDYLQDLYPTTHKRPLSTTGPGDDLYREMLESAADGIYGLDADGYVTFVNPAARRMTGWSVDDLRGRTQHSMVHHSHADGTEYPREECPIYAALNDGRVHQRTDEVFWRKDGTNFPVTYTSSPIFREGKPAGAVIIFREITRECEA